MATTAPRVVECSGVSKTFGSGPSAVDAVSDACLTLQAGTLTMLAGPSGCGKTTLLSLIAGLLTPTNGHVDVLGTRLHRLSDRRLTQFRRDSIGFVTQQDNLLPMLTAAENVCVPLSIRGQPRRSSLEPAQRLLDLVGLSHRSQALPRQLSGGEQQRVAIARALIHEPALIVCDEPTSALDFETGRSVVTLLQSLAAHPSRAVFMVTHDSRMFDLADHVITMEDGRITK